MITENDIEFLSKQTNLTTDRVKSLVEEKKDLDLLIESILTKPSSNKVEYNKIIDGSKLSFNFSLRLIIFRYACYVKFQLEEKSLVCDLVSQYFGEILHNNRPRKFIKTPASKEQIKDFVQYCFVLVCLFPEKLTEIQMKRYYEYLRLLPDIGYNNIWDHLKDWLVVFKALKEGEI